MKYLILLVCLLALAVAHIPRALDHNTPPRRFCGTNATTASPEFRKWHVHHNTTKRPHTTKRDVGPFITTDLYFHVVQTTAGQIPMNTLQLQLGAQLVTLRSMFRNWGIVLNFQTVTYTINDYWGKSAIVDKLAYKQMGAALRQGTYSTLNVFFITGDDSWILGTTSLPSTVPDGADPSIYSSDISVVSIQTLTGSTNPKYNFYTLGYTAVHEVGHWFGLYHPFEGNSCATGPDTGDHCADTKPQSRANLLCDPTANSCPMFPGYDNIHNFMDYTPDSCMTVGFTNDQLQLMFNSFYEWRHGK